MRLKIEFDLVENIEKQKEDWGVKPEIIAKFKDNKEEFHKKHIEDIKNVIKNEFTFDEYEWVENLKVEMVEKWKKKKDIVVAYVMIKKFIIIKCSIILKKLNKQE